METEKQSHAYQENASKYPSLLQINSENITQKLLRPNRSGNMPRQGVSLHTVCASDSCKYPQIIVHPKYFFKKDLI